MISLGVKIILVVALIYFGLHMAKKALKNWVRGLLGLSNPSQKKAEVKDRTLAPCARCGTQVAPSIGVIRKGHFYCSVECANKGLNGGG